MKTESFDMRCLHCGEYNSTIKKHWPSTSQEMPDPDLYRIDCPDCGNSELIRIPTYPNGGLKA